MILVAATLCLLVTYRAHDEITDATVHGAQAITYVNAAYLALVEAQTSVTTDFSNTSGALGDFGTTSEDYTAAAAQDLELAAENDVAGSQGVSDLQTAQGLIANYNDLVQQLSVDASENSSPPLTMADLWDVIGGVQSILSELSSLDQAEQTRVSADLGSRWLSPGGFWWLLLAPFFVMLLLAIGSSHVTWRRFHRVLSARLAATLAVTLGLIALVAALNVHDSGHAEAAINRQLASKTGNKFSHTVGDNTQSLKSVQKLAQKDCSQCAKVVAGPIKQMSHGGGTSLDAGTPYSADTGFAYSLWALVAGLVLAVGAIILAYTAYRPRLEEYRYRL